MLLHIFSVFESPSSNCLSFSFVVVFITYTCIFMVKHRRSLKMNKEDYDSYSLFMKNRYSDELQGLYDTKNYLIKRIRNLEIRKKPSATIALE